MEKTTIKHDFKVLFKNTANKDGTKYLGKNGEQGYRCVTVIDGEKYANMLYDEELLPTQGKEYTISIFEKDGWKNWEYKLLTKTEQIKAQVAPQETPFEPHAMPVYDNKGEQIEQKPTYVQKPDPVQERILRGMCGNQAAAMITLPEEYDAKTTAGVHFALTKEIYELEKDWLTSQ